MIWGQWTSIHDVSHDIYNHIYFLVKIYLYVYKIAKVKFQKLIPLSMLYTHTWILLFLVYYFETVYVKNDSKLYFWESIHYIIYDLFWQYCNRVRMFSNGQQDSLQLLPT